MSVSPWWDESSGFFGEFYVQGDHSVEGHLVERQQSVDDRTRNEVDGIIRLLEITKPLRILDIPCGYGRHAIELAFLGHEVVGSDINERHLAIAREISLDRSIYPSFIKENMLALNRFREFDILINMFYSFGFFDTDAENILVLDNFFSALKPGGKLLMHTDVNIPRILDGKYKMIESRSLVGGGTLHICERFNHLTKRVEGTWTIELNGDASTKPYSVRVYDESEFRNMCLDVGFDTCCSYGGWHREPYSRHSEEIIFVATKALHSPEGR